MHNTVYIIQDTHKLYAACEACSVFAIHYKYMVEVLEKNIRSTEFIDHSFERNLLWRVLWAALKTIARAKSYDFLHIYT